MKKNEQLDLHGKTIADLKKMLQETQKEQAITRLEATMGKHVNVHIVKDLRKKAAIIKTIIREKELGGGA